MTFIFYILFSKNADSIQARQADIVLSLRTVRFSVDGAFHYLPILCNDYKEAILIDDRLAARKKKDTARRMKQTILIEAIIVLLGHYPAYILERPATE